MEKLNKCRAGDGESIVKIDIYDIKHVGDNMKVELFSNDIRLIRNALTSVDFKWYEFIESKIQEIVDNRNN